MAQTYTALIQQRKDWWIGWIEEIPGVNCQERTREELLDALRMTLIEALATGIDGNERRPGLTGPKA